MTEDHKKEIDQVSGVETTGHEWDGLKELNNPAPRWWLLVFLVCCIWSVWYWVVYPAWPTLSGATKGTAGWTQFTKLEKEQAEIAARQAQYMEKFNSASFDKIMNDPELYAFAQAGGAGHFKENCAQCHGTGGAGGKGYPNLNDDDWLWGGKIEDIYQTIKFGIRSPHDETRLSMMPAFGKDAILTAAQVTAMTDFVIAWSEGKDVSTHAGQVVFQEQCAACHGADGKGMRETGAPNLTDGIWLFGGDMETVRKTIHNGRNGVMPFWTGRLDDNAIRQLAVYVHSLGGGEKSEPIHEQPAATPVTTDEQPVAPVESAQ